MWKAWSVAAGAWPRATLVHISEHKINKRIILHPFGVNALLERNLTFLRNLTAGLLDCQSRQQDARLCRAIPAERPVMTECMAALNPNQTLQYRLEITMKCAILGPVQGYKNSTHIQPRRMLRQFICQQTRWARKGSNLVDVSQSACINHPSIEATARCKQCGTPVCNACLVMGPTGRFCSTVCREKHQAFVQRAQQLDGKARSSFFPKLRRLVGWLIMSAMVVLVLAVIGTLFEIPVLSPLVLQLRGYIGV
jgi:hypothetical protein